MPHHQHMNNAPQRLVRYQQQDSQAPQGSGATCSSECAQACPMVVGGMCNDSAEVCGALVQKCIANCKPVCDALTGQR